MLFSSNGKTPLHWAATANSADVARLLIDHGADIQAMELIGWTTLHIAVRNGALEVAKLLIEAGAELELKDTDGNTPLMLARGHKDMTDLLIEAGAESSLMYAAAANDRELAERLLDGGASPNLKDDESGNSVLHVAAENGAFDVARLLLDRGAVIEAQNNRKVTPLIVAATWSQTELARLLIKWGARVNYCCGHWGTALHHAANLRRTEMAKLLMDQGAQPNAKAEDGQTPLHLAAWRGARDFAEFLIDHGAEVNSKDMYGRTPLDRAIDGDYGEHSSLVDTVPSNSSTFFRIAFTATEDTRPSCGVSDLLKAAKPVHEPVDNQFSATTLAMRSIAAAKFSSVVSLCVATAWNSLSFANTFSI